MSCWCVRKQMRVFCTVACLSHLLEANRLTPVSLPPALSARRPSQHTARPQHCVQQTSIPTMVCGGGGGAAALVDGGLVKGRQCARTYMQAHTHF